MKSFLFDCAGDAAASRLRLTAVLTTERRQSQWDRPWTDVRYDRQSGANSHSELYSDPEVRTATGVLCSEPFFTYRVIGDKPLRANFEMEQKGLAAGLVGRMAIAKMLLKIYNCFTFQP